MLRTLLPGTDIAGGCGTSLPLGDVIKGETLAALGFFFITLPCLAIAACTGFAACGAQRRRAYKALAAVVLTAGLACALIPIGIIVWFLTL
ncbi:hypothetical protein ACFRU3_15635 [Streptomyces sp. NPDC056910]|uniref:hypothetical protein n=1 Tax=Streptomyces sp. NPDC056910 TaxID=3345964 RepID=UPI0036B33A86